MLKMNHKELNSLLFSITCRMNICKNDDFIVKIPNDHTSNSLNKGDVVTIGWQVTDCRALNAI